MVTVGLTGGIGSGKSAVAELLAAKGAVIIDADVLARQAVEPGTPALERIVARFGTEILQEDGTLDRTRLGGIVFSDPTALKDLEAITHPAIRELSDRAVAEAGDDDVVVHVIPLLVESGQLGRFDCIVVVDVDPETQVERVQQRDGHDTEHIRARMASQVSRRERLAGADFVVDNSGTPDELSARVDELWDQLIVMQ